MTELPHSKEAERSVVGQALANQRAAAEVISQGLQPEHFHLAPHRIVFEEIVTSYFADDPIDPLVIGEACSKKLERWHNGDEQQAVAWVQSLAMGQRSSGHQAVDHANVVKRHHDLRALLDMAAMVQREVGSENLDPDEIASNASQRAMEIATEAMNTHEIIGLGDLGRRFIRHMRMQKAMKDQGIEIGVKFGLASIDSFTRGLKPTELLFGGGEPGVGKSAVWWKGAMNYAEGQMSKPKDMRIGTLIFSLEMGEEPSSTRLAQSITGIDGGLFREATVTDVQMQKLVTDWASKADHPLYVNHSSSVRASALRALTSQAIQRHNVGLVVIDHFRYFDLDRRPLDANKEDEEKSRFLKSLAKELNIAIVCIAHTVKSIDTPDGRPTLRHLRGSGQIGADADFVNFLYRPIMYASEKAKASHEVFETDAEMIWAKNRHSLLGSSDLFFDPSVMRIEDA